MKKQMLSLLMGLSLALVGGNRALAEGALSSVSMGDQSPSPVVPGEAATYTLTIAKGNAGNPAAYLSCVGLPAGATASFSSKAIYRGGQTAAEVTLTITTEGSLPGGDYPFTI